MASLCLALAACLHPAVRLHDHLPEGPVVFAALCLLLACSLVIHAVASGWPARIGTLGALALLAGLAADGARGHQGHLTLLPGQGTNRYEEKARRGNAAALRPLGFEALLVRSAPDRAVISFGPDREEAEITPARAASHGGLRFGNPVQSPTGDVLGLTVVLDEGGKTRSVELTPDHPGRSGDLDLHIERYFPDFALDERQQPFTRSHEPRNPAALLRVTRAGRVFRVFVIRSYPGLHQVADLGISFGLSAVLPEAAVRLDVFREPFAAVLGAGGLLLLTAVTASLPWPRRRP
jgi:hypothetical protein